MRVWKLLQLTIESEKQQDVIVNDCYRLKIEFFECFACLADMNYVESRHSVESNFSSFNSASQFLRENVSVVTS